MERPEQPSPTSSGSQPNQGEGGGTLGCMSIGCAILGIMLVVPFLGVIYGYWWQGGTFVDGFIILSGLSWIVGEVVLVVGLILGGAGLTFLRCPSGSSSGARIGWQVAGPLICAASLLASSVAVGMRWHHW
jgi:hypothetical protein